MTNTSTRAHAGAPATVRDARLAAILAAALGVVILVGAGFAPGPVHNAAHDSRHSAAFPCH